MSRRSLRRREFIASGSALASAGVAGCSSSLGFGDDVFETVEVNGTELDVEFAEGSDISSVTLTSDGELVTETAVSPGETKVSLPLVEMDARGIRATYYPGEHTITAQGDENHEYDLSLEPESEITDLEAVETGSQVYLMLTVSNEGNAPELVHDIEVTHDAVDSNLEFGDPEGDGNGFIVDPSADGDGEYYDHFPIDPDGSAIFRTYDPVLGFDVSSRGGVYESPAELEDEWLGETIDVPVRLGATTEAIDAVATVQFEGDVVAFMQTDNSYFEDTEVVDFSTGDSEE